MARFPRKRFLTALSAPQPPPRSPSFAGVTIALLALGWAGSTGCGGATGTAQPKDGAHLSDEQRIAQDLDDAEQRVLEALSGERAYASPPPPPGQPISPTPAPTSGGATAPTPPPPEQEGRDELGLENEATCNTACDALAAMRRATDRLCALAPDSPSCEDARERVARAAELVASRCPTCEGVDV